MACASTLGFPCHAHGAACQRPTPGLAPKTVKNVHRMVHGALPDAVAWGYTASNPAVHAQLPREKRRRQRRQGDVWTPEQFTAWLRIAVADRDADMWVLAATTGARRSELARVTDTQR
jgi:integrase